MLAAPPPNGRGDFTPFARCRAGSGPDSLSRMKTLIRPFLALALVAAAPPSRETWSIVRFGGNPAGYLHETVSADDAGRAVTVAESRFVLNRLGSRVEMATSLATTESTEGALLEARAEIRLSRETTRAVATFDGGSMRLVTTAGGRDYERTTPLERPVVGPEGARKLSLERLKKAGDRVEYDSFAGEHLAVVRVAREVAAVEDGLLRVAETSASGPPRKIWLDAEGRVARSVDTSPFGEIEASRAPREAAIAAAEGEDAGRLPEETYARTVVRSNVRLPRSRDLDSITLRVRALTPELELPDLAVPGQAVLSRKPGEVVVRVERPRPPSAPVARPVSLPAGFDRALLDPNGYLASDDPEVRRIAGEVAGGETDAWRAAIRLERWVNENMTMDLGVVFAPASEIVRNRRGTCVAYTVLLSSLARAAGLPTRAKMGFVYVNGAWGGHAWTEVLVGDRFLPLDAAVLGPAPAGSARLAFGASTLGSGWAELNAAGQRMYGHVDIDVIEYAVAGRAPVAVADGAAPYAVEGDRWSSPGLGLSLEKPAGFAFEKLDAIWPDDTLVAMRGGEGETLRLRQFAHEPGGDAAVKRREAVKGGDVGEREIAGRPAARAIVEGRAALAVSDGIDLFVLESEGPAAAARLDAVAATIRFSGAP